MITDDDLRKAEIIKQIRDMIKYPDMVNDLDKWLFENRAQNAVLSLLALEYIATSVSAFGEHISYSKKFSMDDRTAKITVDLDLFACMMVQFGTVGFAVANESINWSEIEGLVSQLRFGERFFVTEIDEILQKAETAEELKPISVAMGGNYDG